MLCVVSDGASEAERVCTGYMRQSVCTGCVRVYVRQRVRAGYVKGQVKILLPLARQDMQQLKPKDH